MEPQQAPRCLPGEALNPKCYNLIISSADSFRQNSSISKELHRI